MQQNSYVSAAAIKSRVAKGEIARFNEDVNEYDRSDTIPSVHIPIRSKTMDRDGASNVPATNDDDESCWGKWCDKEKEKTEGGRKTYRKNKRRVVHKKRITRRNKYNKQKRISK